MLINNQKENLQESEYRYERKFFIDNLTIEKIESIVRLNSFVFSEIYSSRYINNIYFDTNSFSNYFDNVDGLSNRFKVRVRWYGELFGKVKEPRLEIKLKRGLIGKKLSIPMNAFHLNNETNIKNLINFKTLAQKKININLNNFEPKLLNRYKRKYFLSKNKKFRITIDDNQIFYHTKNKNNYFLNFYKDLDSKVLEIKYDKSYDSHINKVSSSLPFRLSKSSKYITGIQKVWKLYN